MRTMIRIGLKKLISSFMSWHLSTHNISSKSMHAFLSDLILHTDWQTNKRVLVGGNNSSTNTSYNQWKRTLRSHRLLKYNQNRRFTTQLESMEGSQCEPRLYFSNNAKTLSLEQPASVWSFMLSRTIFNPKRILRWCTRTEAGRQEQ